MNRDKTTEAVQLFLVFKLRMLAWVRASVCALVCACTCLCIYACALILVRVCVRVPSAYTYL